MCGIAGIVWKEGAREVDPLELERMTRVLAHRGPDGAGFHREPGMGFGHRRLSVIDLEGGAQPLANEDGSVWVTFNGEIYNYVELTKDLEQRGHRFSTRSDTEVLVHLYEEHGEEMVDRLRGMFAFAIWDRRARKLVLVRDRLGKKPLVYWHDAEGLRFASELKSLCELRDFPRTVSPASVDQFLAYQYVPHPWTIYEDARKLPPGSLAVYQGGILRVKKYWKPGFEKEETRSWNDDREALRRELSESTRVRLKSDVPLGAFLSGGIDSTIVVGLMQQMSERPIQTFSIGFPVLEYDETRYARMAAEHLGTQHREFIVDPARLPLVETIVDRLAKLYDEPFGDSSSIPTYFLSQWTREHVTVALTGDGGDELFLGYDRYRAARWGSYFDRVPSSVRGFLLSALQRILPRSGRQKSFLRRARRFVDVLGMSPRARYEQLVCVFDQFRRDNLYADGFDREIAQTRRPNELVRWYEDSPDRDFLTQTSFVDLNTYLPLDILTKVDLASMAHGLECRSPFLDHHVVDLASSMPVDRKIGRRGSKVILKETFEDLLPAPIRNRSKMGFGVPLDYWFRGELNGFLRDVLLSRSAVERGFFSRSSIENIIGEHESGKWDHSARLWCLLMFELWAISYLDSSKPS